MIRPNAQVSAYLYAEPVDMRKSIDGLAALVEAEMVLSPFSEAVFVFCNRSRDKIKLLVWERNGFVVWYKRLEKQRFRVPRPLDGAVELDGVSLNALLDGLDIFAQNAHQRLHYSSVL